MFTIYSADVTGNPGNCSYPHKHVILDEASLKDGICHDYVCAEYRNNYRNGDNFIGSDCLPVDCDNDHTEDPAGWKTPEDVMGAFPGVTFAIHYSRFNMREKNGKPARPKFHVLFPIDYVTDAALYSDMRSWSIPSSRTSTPRRLTPPASSSEPARRMSLCIRAA